MTVCCCLCTAVGWGHWPGFLVRQCLHLSVSFSWVGTGDCSVVGQWHCLCFLVSWSYRIYSIAKVVWPLLSVWMKLHSAFHKWEQGIGWAPRLPRITVQSLWLGRARGYALPVEIYCLGFLSKWGCSTGSTAAWVFLILLPAEWIWRLSPAAGGGGSCEFVSCPGRPKNVLLCYQASVLKLGTLLGHSNNQESDQPWSEWSLSISSCPTVV